MLMYNISNWMIRTHQMHNNEVQMILKLQILPKFTMGVV